MLVALIMAGGIGERFWPLSTSSHPKQLLKLFSDKEMIRETIDRILPIIPIERIFIATNQVQERAIKEVLLDLGELNLIIEPSFKDTAAAIGFGVINIQKKYPQATVVVLASDHIIKDATAFRKVLLMGADIASTNNIVTLGIIPSRIETGYGYIEVGDYSIGIPKDVISFQEKPNLKKAQAYFNSKRYLWNSGMFIFTIPTIMDAFKEHAPLHYAVLKEIANNKLPLEESFLKFEKKSIDYAIMEKAHNIKVIPTEIGWNDVGSFSAYDEIFPKNENGTVDKSRKLIEINSQNNIVIGKKLLVATIGVSNLVIVETDNELLVCSKEEAQNIKQVFLKLKEDL